MTVAGRTTKVFAVACLVAIVAGLVYGVLLYQQASLTSAFERIPAVPTGAPGSQGSLPSSVEADYRALWTRLNYAEKDVEAMHKLLALTTIISAIFGIALGVNAYFGLTQTLDSARRELETIQQVSETAQKAITDIRGDFPSIANMNTALDGIVKQVTKALTPDFDWTQNYYKYLSESTRQSILLHQYTIAGFLFFDLTGRSKAVGEIYEGMAIFFASYYAFAFEDTTLKRLDLRERALQYFAKALAMDECNARARKNRAVLLMYHEEDVESCRKALNELVEIRSQSQEIPGILLNLGIVFINPAIKRYTESYDALKGPDRPD